MATLTVQTPGEDGGLTMAAADVSGDVYPNAGGDVYFICENADASSTTVTVTAQITSTSKDGFGPVTKGNGGGSVAAGAIEVFGPFPSSAFNNASGQVAVTYSSVTSLTVAAFK